jgi:hypothetical protein
MQPIIEFRPWWPPDEPRGLNFILPNSKSKSSQITNKSFKSILFFFASAITALPDKFINVSGIANIKLAPATRILALKAQAHRSFLSGVL